MFIINAIKKFFGVKQERTVWVTYDPETGYIHNIDNQISPPTPCHYDLKVAIGTLKFRMEKN